MGQVVDASISSSRSLVPDHDILSKIDGVNEVFEEETLEFKPPEEANRPTQNNEASPYPGSAKSLPVFV